MNENKEAMKELAGILKGMYDAFLEAGFDKNTAFNLMSLLIDKFMRTPSYDIFNKILN